MARVEIYNYHPIFTQFLASLALSSLRAAPITGPASFRGRSGSGSLALSETNRTVGGELAENGPRRNLQLSPHFYSVSGQFGWVKFQGGPDCRSGVFSGSFRFWFATNIIENRTKIALFNEVGSSTPLYEENSTMVESNTTMHVKIKMKTSEVFLLRVKLA